jgi:diguanylate cyclase (GGDEF)-like protein
VTTDAAAAPRRVTFRDVLAIKEFRALYIAQLLSIAGDQLARIAVAVLVFDRSGSPLLTGLSYAVSYLPWIVGGPLLSGFADRSPRRRVMLVCDLLRTAVLLVMAVPGLPLWTLITLVAVVALGEPPFDSARSALIPDVVGEGERYSVASTLANSSVQLAVVVGFAGGGAVVGAVGARQALVIDGITFALSAWLTKQFIRERPAANSMPGSFVRDLREGATVVFKNDRLRWLVTTTWLVLGVTVATESLAVPYASSHHSGSTTAGVLIACLPLGMMVGALVLGRIMTLAAAERLMLPLALLSPLILALTAFNPAPPVTAVMWFLAGLCAAMTVTANRVFMLSVSREVRGRAFGIAVTGIAAAQGVFNLLAGAVAKYTGPAHALADLALPTFAVLVGASIAAESFRSASDQPITDRTPAKVEDSAMPASPRRSGAQVWLLNAVLALAATAAIPLLRHESAFTNVHLPAWWLFVVFIVGEAYPLEFSIRNQSFEIVLETVPLVLGLIFLPPLELVALRISAVGLVHGLVHRLTRVKWFFNVASTGIASLAATEVFQHLAPSGHGLHPAIWPAAFCAVITSEVVFGILLLIVLTLSGNGSDLARTARVLSFGLSVTIVLTFLALLTAAALAYDTTTAWAISIFVFLVVTGAQTYHRLAERAAALDRLYVVARELGPVASEPGDLGPALIQLRQAIGARSLQLLLTSLADEEFVTVVTVSESSGDEDRLSIEEGSYAAYGLADIARPTTERRWRSLMKPASATRRQSDRISALVVSGDREMGVLSALQAPGQSSAFDRSDLRLLEAAASQLAAALEKGRLIDSLRKAATLDSLTGLANLDSLRSFLDTTLEAGAGGVLILLNLDRFREVNDMLGHGAGDAVLAQVARRLESSPSQDALVARVGGDQFALAIPGAAGSEVARLAAMAVKSRVDGSIRLTEVSADVRVTAGIARAPEHGNDAATLLRRAEMAMAAAKGSSSGIGEWEPEFERDGSRRLQLLTGLRAALSDGSLRVEYQPKMVVGAGGVAGFEALVRWNHPELGPISPSEFVPLAEAAGLISALTSTVLRHALTACRRWHDDGKPVGVAVNVSARSLDDNVLVGQVAAMLTASGLDPRWLTLEITESSVMEDHARSLEVLRELRMLGVRLSIDDFGTGYSSLHQLRGMPVHEVKIDRSFVEAVDTDEAGRAVVRAIVELCDSLNLVTVAEGVEKASQAYALEAIGVEQVQGYFHGKPMTAAAVLKWISTRKVASLVTL